MTHKLLGSDRFDRYVVVFANTGREHPKTLDFVHRCDTELGFGTVWIEAVTHPEHGKNVTHRIVDYETASRDGTPFEDVIRKYGVPNATRPLCTTRLKVYPIESYLRSVGIDPKTVPTAIGIRADEARRVANKDRRRIIYPLIDDWVVDKDDVVAWWNAQPFDLEIDEFEGNCLGCLKKGVRQHFLMLDKDPRAFDWIDRIEKQYGHVKAKAGRPFCWFRRGMSTEQMRAEHARAAGHYRPPSEDDSGGCGESCEVYETE